MTTKGKQRTMKLSTDMMAKKAVMLFRIIEDLRVPCGYERSFKILKHTLLANRFLLGINTKTLKPDQLVDVCRQLDMPTNQMDLFQAQLPDANVVFLGFEDGEADSLYKVYLEFWEKVKTDIRSKSNKQEPALLHLGFKWDTNDNTRQTISEYICYPMLPTEDIMARLSNIYQSHEDRSSQKIAEDIITFAGRRNAGSSFIYLEVGEEDNPRKSFDINLYNAQFRLCEIASSLFRMSDHFSIPSEQFNRLYQLVGDKLFGHLAGGLNRDGNDFLTVYYEP